MTGGTQTPLMLGTRSWLFWSDTPQDLTFRCRKAWRFAHYTGASKAASSSRPLSRAGGDPSSGGRDGCVPAADETPATSPKRPPWSGRARRRRIPKPDRAARRSRRWSWGAGKRVVRSRRSSPRQVGTSTSRVVEPRGYPVESATTISCGGCTSPVSSRPRSTHSRSPGRAYGRMSSRRDGTGGTISISGRCTRWASSFSVTYSESTVSALVSGPDLPDSLAWGDQRYFQLVELFTTFAAERGIPKPEVSRPAPLECETRETLDLKGLAAIVFAGGFRPDYESWVRIPDAFDQLGFPIHEDGASPVAKGLYFIGVHFLRKRKSSSFTGLCEDAPIVARRIAEARRGSE